MSSRVFPFTNERREEKRDRDREREGKKEAIVEKKINDKMLILHLYFIHE